MTERAIEFFTTNAPDENTRYTTWFLAFWVDNHTKLELASYIQILDSYNSTLVVLQQAKDDEGKMRLYCLLHHKITYAKLRETFGAGKIIKKCKNSDHALKFMTIKYNKIGDTIIKGQLPVSSSRFGTQEYIKNGHDEHDEKKEYKDELSKHKDVITNNKNRFFMKWGFYGKNLFIYIPLNDFVKNSREMISTLRYFGFQLQIELNMWYNFNISKIKWIIDETKGNKFYQALVTLSLLMDPPVVINNAGNQALFNIIK